MTTTHGRKPPPRTARRRSHANPLTDEGGRVASELAGWRSASRVPELRALARDLAGLKWTRALFLLVLDELYIDDLFVDIVGNPEKLSPARYPQAVAMAIALRHSWRPDDLAEVATRLALPARRFGRGGRRPRRSRGARVRGG